ncbi:MAG TPA: homoserine dehydrogenase [Atribacter sp.]|jgi:homoserine dehydrogenase|uniref:Homoserine dehydrogenase n=1 Tax=Candidatus Atribacter allofermentans TaxID=1852833 RepID=A0A1V5SIF8_9BACT|nr:homoserine dehydrogenase [Atribacter sp.]OQA54114.1 MAG: Homoserine dehydrogenase [Candidatus Atribacteria bacterium ADurb.Bin276]HQK82384.1 homoserine dehydrogenase [Atribacter sp.]
MRQIKVGVIGFGTVGMGTVKALWNQKEEIEKELGVGIKVVKIVDKEWMIGRPMVVPPDIKSSDPSEVIDDPEIEIVVEAVGGIDPAFEYVSQALARGKTVITPNKELIAKKGRELFQLAAQNETDVYFEGAVGGGIPIIHTLKEQLLGDDILEVIGIVNGTTNYILSEMSLRKSSFEKALEEAKRKGFAEPVPTNDIEGFDSTYKIAILATLCFHGRVDVDKVYREGITRILTDDIEYARELGYTIKLLAIARRIGEDIELRVQPVLLPLSHPLSSVFGVENAIYVRSRTRDLTFRGPGAGGDATGSAMVGDIIDAIRNIKYAARGRVGCTCMRDLTVLPMESLLSQNCVRVLALDVPGVLGKIASEFGNSGVSLSAVKQPISTPGKLTNIYFLTHRIQERNIQNAIKSIQKLDVVKDVYAIRVEDGES